MEIVDNFRKKMHKDGKTMKKVNFNFKLIEFYVIKKKKKILPFFPHDSIII